MTRAVETPMPVELQTSAGRVAGRGTGPVAEDSPLVVALHGGGYDCGYFDVPGHSLLDIGAAAGFEVVALDRPGTAGVMDRSRTS